MSPAAFPGKWARKLSAFFLSALSFIVFLFLDYLETLLCLVCRCLDKFFEGKASPCYCESRGGWRSNGVASVDGEEIEVSETLYGRRNVFREMGFLGFARKWKDSKKISGGGGAVTRWSDCGCENCVLWATSADQKLHVVVREPSRATIEDSREKPSENVIFLHGFLSSSSFWTETVFQNLSEPAKNNQRLFAVDLLGFGRSPKPRDCLYTLKDHLEMIEKSVINPFQLNSFHLVAHSMGCIIALALAAKYSKLVKSITLVAPPYFPSSKYGASLAVLNRLAERKLWPPVLFGSSFMSWYEHLGRFVCFVICRNHRIWEGIFKLLTLRRNLHFTTMDLTRHTHHSAWHTMHNVICGGAKFMDDYLETVIKSGVKIWVIQGDQDLVVPLECCNNIKIKCPDAKVDIIANTDHATVVLGRQREFTRNLEHTWASFANVASKADCCPKDSTTA